MTKWHSIPYMLLPGTGCFGKAFSFLGLYTHSATRIARYKSESGRSHARYRRKHTECISVGETACTQAYLLRPGELSGYIKSSSVGISTSFSGQYLCCVELRTLKVALIGAPIGRLCCTNSSNREPVSANSTPHTFHADWPAASHSWRDYA
jgi:hypothetical protein